MKMSESLNAIYVVLRKDFDHHTDRKGRLALPIGAFKSAASANKAAESHCEKQAAKRPDYGDDPEHEEKGGLYKGRCYTREDRRDHFEVWVAMMKLGDAEKPSALKKRKSEGVAAESVPAERGQKAPRTGT
ncbi:hypothetical protein F5Y00DRAFT_242986 [Daldinia vernicosa]|uniref:uncharacterized protein n=1 Tax=Daldinia vernicosa TaxID=114800 RepID=UPI002007F461|nr:uncharacterized protein F5Y00DRAFT_242986 [Daldinia vernicosa]KAI0846767.1 hypothetical protein F5Y00DRAFT_242986 [Daldinia vernicosa]